MGNFNATVCLDVSTRHSNVDDITLDELRAMADAVEPVSAAAVAWNGQGYAYVARARLVNYYIDRTPPEHMSPNTVRHGYIVVKFTSANLAREQLDAFSRRMNDLGRALLPFAEPVAPSERELRIEPLIEFYDVGLHRAKTILAQQ